MGFYCVLTSMYLPVCIHFFLNNEIGLICHSMDTGISNYYLIMYARYVL